MHIWIQQIREREVYMILEFIRVSFCLLIMQQFCRNWDSFPFIDGDTVSFHSLLAATFCQKSPCHSIVIQMTGVNDLFVECCLHVFTIWIPTVKWKVEKCRCFSSEVGLFSTCGGWGCKSVKSVGSQGKNSLSRAEHIRGNCPHIFLDPKDGSKLAKFGHLLGIDAKRTLPPPIFYPRHSATFLLYIFVLIIQIIFFWIW